MALFGLKSTKQENRKSAPQPLNAASASEASSTDLDTISPELVPIVTLLLAQNNRRYYEGVFMFYYDLSTDGKLGDRTWKEVYGILTGNQLAYWDAKDLALCRDAPERLLETSCRPQYLNFLDAVFNAMSVLPTAKLQLENVIVVLTTLKNRFILQLRTKAQMQELLAALRLSAFEYQALQEAYTGALLSARGLQLSDIRTVLTATRYNHSEWVKIRYGSGTAWKRCYMVIEPLVSKRKGLSPGRILIYESDTMKRKENIGEISAVTSICAVYPQLHLFIDRSTMMKLEGRIHFKQSKKKRAKDSDFNDNIDASLFMMPEEHHSVPGYDTLIRFLIPLFDAFGQYGRPKRLKADRMDPESLLFGLPTLPCIHYLEVTELMDSIQTQQYIEWSPSQWRSQIKGLLSRKLSQGYNGCGSAKSSTMIGQLKVPGSPRILSPLSSGRFPAALSPSPTNSDLQNVIGSDRRGSYGNKRFPSNMNSGISSGSGHGSMPVTKVSGGGSPQKPYTPLVSGRSASKPRNELAEIYHNYTKLQTPSDNFNDRNKILDGAVEELDESKLPTLMRKKSLMHGPYPTRDKFIGESDDSLDEVESSDESDEEEPTPAQNYTLNNQSHIAKQPEKPPHGQFLAPNQYEERNASYSSVQSPNTQYVEFNKQFSKNFANPHHQSLALNNSDLESDGESDREAPPPPMHGASKSDAQAHAQQERPQHLAMSGSISQFPQSQQSQQLHQAPQRKNSQPPLTPALGEKFRDEAPRSVYGSLPLHGQRSGMLTPSESTFAKDNSPRYIRSPNQTQGGQTNPSSNSMSKSNPSPINGNGAYNQLAGSNQMQNMQNMQNRFQQTNLDGRGYGQNYPPNHQNRPTYLGPGSKSGQGPSPMQIPGQGQRQGSHSYNTMQQQPIQHQHQQQQHQRPMYHEQGGQSGSPQQRGQNMQRPNQQMHGIPSRPQGYGTPSGQQYGGPPPQQQAAYRAPNQMQHPPSQMQYGSQSAGAPQQYRSDSGPGPNMQHRPNQGAYPQNPGMNSYNQGQQPRPMPHTQQSSLSMRSQGDQQQYQYQVNPNIAPRRGQNPQGQGQGQGQYPGPGPHNGNQYTNPHSRYQ